MPATNTSDTSNRAQVAEARRSAAALRIGLVILAVSQGGVGGWALVAPGAFFSGFPVPGHPWVAKLPPYNEHLIRDVGSLSLALTVVFVAAAVTLDRRLAAVSVTGFGVYAVPHLVFTRSTWPGSVGWTQSFRRAVSCSSWPWPPPWPGCWPATATRR